MCDNFPCHKCLACSWCLMGCVHKWRGLINIHLTEERNIMITYFLLKCNFILWSHWANVFFLLANDISLSYNHPLLYFTQQEKLVDIYIHITWHFLSLQTYHWDDIMLSAIWWKLYFHLFHRFSLFLFTILACYLVQT